MHLTQQQLAGLTFNSEFQNLLLVIVQNLFELVLILADELCFHQSITLKLIIGFH